MIRRLIACAVVGVCTVVSSAAEQLPVSAAATFVRSLLDTPEDEMDFARSKLAIDKFADVLIDMDTAAAEIEGMVATVEEMIDSLPPELGATSIERMKALRAFLYEPGWWNDDRPFQYDPEDPYGQKIRAQSLSNYLKSKKGNCVSMPKWGTSKPTPNQKAAMGIPGVDVTISRHTAESVAGTSTGAATGGAAAGAAKSEEDGSLGY